MTRTRARVVEFEPVPACVREIATENPNRWLNRATDAGLAMAAPMVRGIRRPERAYVWIVCEAQRKGGPRKRVLRALVAKYWSLRGIDPRGNDSEWVRVGATESLRPHPGTDEFEQAKARVLDASQGQAPADVRQRMQQEADRENPRRHVIAGLNEALQVVETGEEASA